MRVHANIAPVPPPQASRYLRVAEVVFVAAEKKLGFDGHVVIESPWVQGWHQRAVRDAKRPLARMVSTWYQTPLHSSHSSVAIFLEQQRCRHLQGFIVLVTSTPVIVALIQRR